MSEPQFRETWDTEQPKGMGVIMSEDQYEKFIDKMNLFADETTRREKAVAEALEDLKKVEIVKTYGNFVRDITMSLQTLSSIPNTENARESLLKSLAMANEAFNPTGVLGGEEKKILQDKQMLPVQTDEGTTEESAKISE